MTKKFATLLVAAFLAISATGCSVLTEGEAFWEVYAGVRHKQKGDKQAKVALESTVVTRVVDWLTDGEPTDGEVTEAE